MKILIVDDSPDDRRLLRYNLVRHGCETVEAENGEEGLAAAARELPDLIVSDALMPRMDGFQFLKSVKEDPRLRHIPFVFYSAVYTGYREEELAESMGAAAFFIKPQEPEKLWEEIAAIAQRWGAEDENPAVTDEEEYRQKYTEIVARKLEEKVRELEATVARCLEAESALKAAATSYRRIFESSKDGIVVVDGRSGRITDVNPAIISILGYPAEAYRGKEVRNAAPFAGTPGWEGWLAGMEEGDIRHDGISLTAAGGNEVIVDMVSTAYAVETNRVVQINIRDVTKRKRAEQALRKSELERHRLQAELGCAAAVQRTLLPTSLPELPGFDIAARCLPAHQVGGDFYDWMEVAPGVVALTLGDVMGSGMSAAMLMTTVRAAVHAAMLENRPAAAIQLVARAVMEDLERSESFVTLFHGHLDSRARTLTFVDCGHGYAFLRRRNGEIEELVPRGLPLGIPTAEICVEGSVTFDTGDALVVYTDGLVGDQPEQTPGNRDFAPRIAKAASAGEIVDILLELPGNEPAGDDLTVMAVLCR